MGKKRAAISTIPFPCQIRQNEIELCQDENQDRVNEFRFREKNIRQNETEFCQKLSFATAEKNFGHAKLILFLAKLSCTLAIFNFVQAELTFISAAEFRWKRYSAKCLLTHPLQRRTRRLAF